MKRFLQNLIARKKAELADVEKRMKASSEVEEVRSLGETLLALRDEISDAEQQLADFEAGEDNGTDNGSGEGEGQAASGNPDEGRSGNPKNTNFKPMSTYGQNNGEQSRSNGDDEDPRGTMEYRKAFMEFFKTGTRSQILQTRGSDDQTDSTDLGVLLPITVVQEIIKGVEKVYGQLYAGVKKTNLKGGVKYPLGSFDATFTRIGETGAPTDRQNAVTSKGYVEFSYKIGEIRLAQTLLANILSVPVFEQELAKTIVEAYVKAMDVEILNGGNSTLFPTEYTNQMEGILTEAAKQSGSRIIADNIIEFTEEDMADWKKWQTNLFAKIPLSMRGLSPKFVMTPNTYEANIKTLHDDNNRPVHAETFNPVDGSERATFKGKEVTFVEEGLGFENFDDADAGEYFGMYWVPEKAYAINTNLEFAVKRYFDEEKLQYVDRAIVINDGKILDPKYIYLLKKVASV